MDRIKNTIERNNSIRIDTGVDGGGGPDLKSDDLKE